MGWTTRSRETRPQARFTPQARTVVRVFLALAVLLVAPTPAAAQPELSISRTAVLGGRDAGGGLEFGVPRAAALTGDHIWLLDEVNFRVDVIDRATGRRYSLGRSGSGPDEFRDVASLAVVNDSTVVVLDRANVRLVVIRFSRDRLFQLRTIPLDVLNPQAVCSVSGRTILLGARQGRQLHEIDLNSGGKVVRSFGIPFRADEPRLERHATRGFLSCANRGRGAPIVAVSEEFGEVHAYGIDGDLHWQATLPRFRPIEVTFAGSAITYSPPHDGVGVYNVMTSLTRLDAHGILLAQVGAVSHGIRKREIAAVTTHILNAADGVIVASSGEYPRLDFVSGDQAIGIDNSLYPALYLYTIRP
jgi:hypothetical protein